MHPLNPIILTVNLGSTSAKLAVFQGADLLAERAYPLPKKSFAELRAAVGKRIEAFLVECDIAVDSLDAVAARGGLMRPLPSGVYAVNENMLSDLMACRYGMHHSNLSAAAAWDVGQRARAPAFAVDPVTTDEMDEAAAVTGVPSIRRRSLFHCLSQKAAVRRAARERGKTYEDVNAVAAHLGGGVSVGAHRGGRVVDVNNALDGDGPMATERAGTVPAWDMARMARDGGLSEEDLHRRLAGEGGMFAHLGTRDMLAVRRRIERGDRHAELIVRAMAYGVVKHIGAMAAALSGAVDFVILTGALTAWPWLVDRIRSSVSFIAPVIVFEENLEMQALAEGALRVLSGEGEALEYARESVRRDVTTKDNQRQES